MVVIGRSPLGDAGPTCSTRGRTCNQGGLFQLALGVLVAGCSPSPAAAPGDAGAPDSSVGDGPAQDGAAGDGTGEGGVEAASCACAAGGACDSVGCPPDYNGAGFAAWCATAQTEAAGHVLSMRTCGSLLLMTYGVDGGCERGYVVDQPGGALVATLDECSGAPFACSALQPEACVPPCCLDKSCTLGISSLCPPWQPDGGD